MQYQIHIDKELILKEIDRKMDEIADKVFIKSQNNIVDKGIIDEGTLLKTGNLDRQFLHKKVIYPVPYADVIEYGRLPGSMPPVEAIQEWVKRKLGVKDEAEAKSIAWAIAKDIKVNGTEPRPYLSPAVESVKNELRS